MKTLFMCLAVVLLPASVFAETYTVIGCSYSPGNGADTEPTFSSYGVGGRDAEVMISLEQYRQIANFCREGQKTMDDPTTCCRLTFEGKKESIRATGGTLKGQLYDVYDVKKIIKVEKYK